MRRLTALALALALAACAASERPEDCGYRRTGECRPSMGEEIKERSQGQAASAISSSVGQAIRGITRRVLTGR